METVVEILKVILPVIITGLFTFFATKYTYNNNRPLDKIEIAYNRVYYPIYRIISDENINKDINYVINKSKTYFIKYDKYIDISTKKLFESLCKCNKETEKKSIYQKFKDNIRNKSYYLRVRLGYLEPNFYNQYKYSSPSAKSSYRILIEIIMTYFSVCLTIITVNFKNNIYFTIAATVFLSLLIILFIEILGRFFRFIYYKIRK